MSLLIPPRVLAQTQDIHALRIVTQSFEKAKKDNKTRQDTATSQKIHKIANLSTSGNFKSIEKVAIFKIYTKDSRPVEELIEIWPPRAKPAPNPVDFDKLLDAFLSRFYFFLSPEGKIISGQKHYKIHFWPREDLPPEKNYDDYILNRMAGLIHINEKTYMVQEIEGLLSRNISEGNFFWSFFMDQFDFKVEFLEWHTFGLPRIVTVTTRYSYRKGFFFTKRFQTHTLVYEYDIAK